MRSAVQFVLARWPWFALAAAASMLAAAHAFETFAHLAPCTLCYKQREAHWAAAGIAAAAIALSLTPWRTRLPWLPGLALAAAFGYGAYLGFFHMGVEFHWWPGPTTCASGAPGRHIDMTAFLQGRPLAAPACDQPQWWFLGLTMAAWNGIISTGLTLASLAAAWSKRR
jgi:disulfide bond formation protein DsbB